MATNKKIEEMIRMLLINQRNIMIWISKGKYSQGYFANNIKHTEEMLDD